MATTPIPDTLAVETPAEQKSISLSYIFLTFLKAGCLGFGGFMSLISVVESTVVKKKKLLKPEDMLDGISLASLLPGPQAVNVVAYAGNKLKGTKGAITAAVAVIIPSFILMVLLSYLYSKYGQLSQVTRFFHGFIPAIAAVILSVVWRMAKQTVKGWKEAGLVIISFLLLFFAPKEYQLYITFSIVILFGFIGYFLFNDKTKQPETVITVQHKFPLAKVGITLLFAAVLIALGLSHPALDKNSYGNLVTTFSGLSLMLFGGGYVIIPMIQHQIVDGFHWLNKNEFVDCIAFSQIMPGPILIAAAFIGYKVKGFLGALLSTIAIFGPPAVLMVVASQALDYFKKSTAAKAVMRGIRCGVIGMILIAVYVILNAPPPRGINWHNIQEIWPTVIIFAGALLALFRFNLDVVYIIPTAGLIGYFLYP
ncbi:MAG: chromate efflux transporter [Chitinophagales bacterium]|nr:chromate efflux transporter [Chitinophagales bacterium]